MVADPRVPTTRGSYALLLKLDCSKVIRVGRLGSSPCPSGYYVYVGSALGPGGLAARLARHRRREKRLFWHIDYLLASAELVDVCHDLSGQDLECKWARTLMSMHGVRVVAPGFGASDCSCSSHLIFLGSESGARWDGFRRMCEGSPSGN
jgi:Uri superfamily endonuclease